MKKNEIKKCDMKNTEKILGEEILNMIDAKCRELLWENIENPNAILMQIPYAKFAFGILKDCKSYSDSKKLKKLLLFFEECREMDIQKVKEFMNDIDEEYDGERLIDAITELDRAEKCVLVGKIYKYLIEIRESQETFFRIINSVRRCHYENLSSLFLFENAESITNDGKILDREIVQNLFIDGFLIDVGIDGGDFSGNEGGTIYELSKCGEVVLKFLPRPELVHL